jgi:hypothetical protein
MAAAILILPKKRCRCRNIRTATPLPPQNNQGAKSNEHVCGTGRSSPGSMRERHDLIGSDRVEEMVRN